MMNESHAGTERATGWIRLRPAGLRRDKEVDQGRSCQCSVCSFAFGPSSQASAQQDLRTLSPPHRITEPLNHCPLTSGLGIPEEKIFTGYDAIDNAYFAARADEIRASDGTAKLQT
jgi:hypothetical protein